MPWLSLDYGHKWSKGFPIPMILHQLQYGLLKPIILLHLPYHLIVVLIVDQQLPDRERISGLQLQWVHLPASKQQLKRCRIRNHLQNIIIGYDEQTIPQRNRVETYLVVFDHQPTVSIFNLLLLIIDLLKDVPKPMTDLHYKRYASVEIVRLDLVYYRYRGQLSQLGRIEYLLLVSHLWQTEHLTVLPPDKLDLLIQLLEHPFIIFLPCLTPVIESRELVSHHLLSPHCHLTLSQNFHVHFLRNVL